MDIQALATEAAKRRRKNGGTMQKAVDDVLKQYSLGKNEYLAHRTSILRECGLRSGRKSRGTRRPPRQLSFKFK